MKYSNVIFGVFCVIASLLWLHHADAYVPPSCSMGSVLNSDQSLGFACTPVAIQKSEIYPSTGNATSGFSDTVTNGVTVEVVNASGLLGSGTVVLPSAPTDGMPLSIECPGSVTLLTVSANSGQSTAGFGIPTLCAPGTPYVVKWSGVNSTWYKNG